MKIAFKKSLPIIILAALICVYFFNIIISKNFLWEDFPVFYFPLKSYVFNSLKHGRIPLWNPNLNLGYPIIADATAAIFYPLNWLAIPFVSGNIQKDYLAIELWAIFHLFLAGVFMYYLVDYLTQENKKTRKRENKLSRAGRFGDVAEPTRAAEQARLTRGVGGLCFLLNEKFKINFDEKSWSNINPAALFSAIAFMFSGFFIGHLKHVAQITTACWFPLIFLFLYKSFKEKKYSFAIWAGIFWGVSILSGHLQIVYHFSFFNGLFILWEIIYNFIEKKNYKKIIIASLLAIIIAVCLSAVQVLPFLKFLKTSTRSEISTGFASSFSLKPTEFFINLFFPRAFGGFKPGVLYFGYGGFFWETAVYVGILTLFLALVAVIKSWNKNNFIFFLLFSSIFCLGLSFGGYSFIHPLLLNILPGLNMIRAPARFILPVIFSFCILAGFGFNYFADFLQKFNKKINTKLFLTGLVFVLFFDMFLFGGQFNNGTIKPNEYYPQIMGRFSDIAEPAHNLRIINDNYLMPNSTYIYNTPIMDSNHYMMIKDYYNFTDGLAENLYYQNKFRDFNNFFENKTRLNLLGIKYIISRRDLTKWFPKIDGDVYENINAYPRFILSKQCIAEKDPEKILKFLDDPDYNPMEAIYIEKGVEGGCLETNSILNPTNALQNNIKIIKYEEEYIKLEIENNGNKWLLANEIYYPGWEATIDGEPIEIYKANYTFRAIPVPTGKHKIEFIFKPKSYFLGRIISLFSVLFLILAEIFNFCHNKNKKKKNLTKI